MIETGYFGVPDGPRRGRYTKVHVVEDNKPICGSKIGKDMKFQWCPHGAYWSFIEREHCKKQAQKRSLV